MVKLNDLNDNTIKNIHLVCTLKCSRDCKYCCNKQYDMINDVPMVSYNELAKAENIFLTGGEPFAFSSPNDIARDLKFVYKNIKNIYCYTNAYELYTYLESRRHNYILDSLDGLTISIKDKYDKVLFENSIMNDIRVTHLKSNRLYVFPGFEDTLVNEHFDKRLREWQTEFKPAPDSIFRRMF